MAQAEMKNHIAAWRKIPPLVAINKWVTRIDTGVNFIGALLIAFVMFMSAAGIIMRYVFNKPIYGKVEITELVMAGIVFFGLAYTQKLGGHVRMSFVIERFIKGRAYHIVEAFTLLISLFTFIILTVTTLDSALYDLEFHGITPNLYLPIWPSKMTVPVGCFFLCIRLVIQFTQHLTQALAGVENREL
jgi:C4-dicarboxylate transporter DctQ subunit